LNYGIIKYVYRLYDNVFGKDRGRNLYCSTTTIDNAVLKHYLKAYNESVLRGVFNEEKQSIIH
jgi:hypothetical protein